MNLYDVLTSNAAKRNFLLGLIRVAKADGKVNSEEYAYFTSFGLHIGLNQDAVDEISWWWGKSQKPQISFETRREALYFIREAIQLCHVDQKYTESEQREIYAIAEELGIEKAAVEPIEAWVAEGMDWNARGDALLEL